MIDILRLMPFSHTPWRSGQKDGKGQQVTVTFAVANTDVSVTLALGKIPDGYVQARASVGGIVYDGTNLGTDWTPKKIVLRATVAGTYRLRIF